MNGKTCHICRSGVARLRAVLQAVDVHKQGVARQDGFGEFVHFRHKCENGIATLSPALKYPCAYVMGDGECGDIVRGKQGAVERIAQGKAFSRG